MTATDTTLAGLYRMILDAPHDDGARLMLADYLEGQGDGDRAEFIRISIELAGMEPGPRICIGDEKDDVLDIAGTGYISKHGGPNYFAATSCYRVQIGDRVDVRTPKGRRLHGLIVRKAEYDEASAVPGIHEYVLCQDAGSVPWAGVSLHFRSAALLALHERTWTADARAMLPKCGRCRGSGKGRHYQLGTEIEHEKCLDCRGSGHDPAYSLTFYKGLVGGISGPSAGLWGAVCRPCGGGGERVVNMRTPPRKCQECKGEGHTPGILSRLVRVAPIVSATATDREPEEISGRQVWIRGLNPEDSGPEYVPDSLWPQLCAVRPRGEFFGVPSRGGRVAFGYPSLALAHAALSTASINHAREAAGLPMLQ